MTFIQEMTKLLNNDVQKETNSDCICERKNEENSNETDIIITSDFNFSVHHEKTHFECLTV